MEQPATRENAEMKSILVATDGSAPARRAVDVACQLAVHFGAEMNVIHVLEPDSGMSGGAHDFARTEHLAEALASDPTTSMPYRGDFPAEARFGEQPPDDPYRVMAEIGERLLVEAATAARERGVARIHTFAESGRPADSIVALAERMQSDMIVIGSRGLSGLHGLLMGSVSRRVVEHAPCICVTVK